MIRIIPSLFPTRSILFTGDTNVMAGGDIRYLNANMENGFLPLPDPSPKSGYHLHLLPQQSHRRMLTAGSNSKHGVSYAREQEAIILYDAAYEAFIQDPDLPRSIFEIEGADTCAIEFCSLSKTAGFTGTACGYTVVSPHTGAGRYVPSEKCGFAGRPPNSMGFRILCRTLQQLYLRRKA